MRLFAHLLMRESERFGFDLIDNGENTIVPSHPGTMSEVIDAPPPTKVEGRFRGESIFTEILRGIVVEPLGNVFTRCWCVLCVRHIVPRRREEPVLPIPYKAPSASTFPISVLTDDR